jgi:dephospho-CoA kinase
MIIIGLTGGIGTGKSTTSRFLSDLGALVLDADSLGHETYKKGTGLYRDLIKAFGQDILDSNGEINRSELAEIVFTDENLLIKLNSMVHPHIKQSIERTIDKLDKQEINMVVIDAAILVEAGWRNLVDELWVVTAERKTIKQRLSHKLKNNMDSALKRSKFQMPQSELKAKADLVIDNEGSIRALRERVTLLFNERIDLARESNK